ncbi:UDP-glucose 4-epimerase GalE [Microbacterium sp. ABRD28]|uniref:UDP-glucose 4-epimerase GalE n=1 Tax=Microbacterium sp. ABRD28 TaxID=2268461 RepID=UPI000F5536AE|nr:UDP-glucose 4-epimerase GalE [Microbacterium sp. ABRD28]AZC13459.1 UDP-glucose 4-epimerase GalE [Microbacterium sp. ABRD28]
MRVLVTGGAGYIGSHVVTQLLAQDHQVHVIDDLSNSSIEGLRRVRTITGQEVGFTRADLREKDTLTSILRSFGPDAVIHLAGLKSVSESVVRPALYYNVNLNTTLVLLAAMGDAGIGRLVFSSSATVYGVPSELPLRETSAVGMGITNPYGRTKYMNELIIADHAAAHPDFSAVLLRYFNPIGAHPSGLIGEDPAQIPNNLAPYVTQVAVGRLPYLQVFGDEYDTPDGTGVRDYVHVMDLADGHVAALSHSDAGVTAVNLGTGRGTSVLELLHAFSAVVGREIPYRIVDPRPGDVAAAWADVARARAIWGWEASRTLSEACVDAWRWQRQNPNGFSAPPA